MPRVIDHNHPATPTTTNATRSSPHARRRRLVARLVALGILLTAGSALAYTPAVYVARSDGLCPAGQRPITPDEAWHDADLMCDALGTWEIARLAGGGSMDGPGYGCDIRPYDDRGLGHTLCTPAPIYRPAPRINIYWPTPRRKVYRPKPRHRHPAHRPKPRAHAPRHRPAPARRPAPPARRPAPPARRPQSHRPSARPQARPPAATPRTPPRSQRPDARPGARQPDSKQPGSRRQRGRRGDSESSQTARRR